MEKITVITKIDEKIIEIDVAIADITGFGISIFRLTSTSGRFKKFVKQHYIMTDKRLICSQLAYKNIKEALRNKYYVVSKETYIENKYTSRAIFKGVKKATEWHFKVK